MDIIQQAKDEIAIFERPSIKTSLALISEVEQLKAQNRVLRDAINYEIEHTDYSSPENCTYRLKKALKEVDE